MTSVQKNHMKIVQINAFYGYGSTGRIVQTLGEKIEENEMDSYVCYGRDMSAPVINERIYKIGTKRDYVIHKWTTHLMGYQCASSQKATKKMVEYLDEIKPDLIHLHILHGHFLNLKVLFEYIRENNLPVVWTFHDCWGFTGHCTYFTDVKCERWKTGCGTCQQKIAYPRSLFFDRSGEQWNEKKKLYGDYDHLYIVTVSKWLENLVRDSFLKDRKIRTIYNGIDCNVFYPRDSYEKIRKKLNLHDEKIVLGVAGGWTKRKGIDDFLEISNKLPSDTKIVLVGLMPEKYKMPDNVICYGSVQNLDELAELYSAAEVFVNPSRNETFGLTTAEAMACGTPAIVYDITACPEVVGQDISCGVCAVPYDVSDLYEKMKEYIRVPRKVHCEAVKRVNECFNKKKSLDSYIELYLEILRDRKNEG